MSLCVTQTSAQKHQVCTGVQVNGGRLDTVPPESIWLWWFNGGPHNWNITALIYYMETLQYP